MNTFKIRSIAAQIEADEHNLNNSQCIHCGAELPRDIDFQTYHMEAIHGLVV